MSIDTEPLQIGNGRHYVCRWCHRSLWQVAGASHNWLASALTLHEQHCSGERYTDLPPEPPESTQLPDQGRQ